MLISPPARSPAPVTRQRPALIAAALSTLAFLGAWTALDLLFNLRAPASEAFHAPFLPSLDATVILVAFALVAARGRRVPRAVVAALGVAVVLVRLFRVGDGVTRRYFNRPLSLAFDLPTSPELVRLLDSTVSRPVLMGGTLVLLAALAAVGLAAAWALRTAERSLARPPNQALLAAVIGLALALAPLAPRRGRDEGARGWFAGSVLARMARQAGAALTLDRYRRTERARLRATVAAADHRPRPLAALHGASVLVFLVESYGETVLERPESGRIITPLYDELGASLRGQGFAVASHLLDSPTYAGRSWLAQETFLTGVRAADHVVDALVQEERPPTMADLFQRAGYRTVLVQPGSTHPGLARWLYDFDVVYSAWDLGYRGPGFRWAPMPDQYVLDVVRRREAGAGPLFATYALVSSHAPWSDQPPLVDDWERIGDGTIFRGLPVTRFPIGWTNLAEGGEAYLRSISYDLRVLERYLTRFVTGEALVIVLGDHQPVAEVTGGSPSSAVPVHVISRNQALVAAFRARGYVDGMRPGRQAPVRGMETFLPDLVEILSTAAP